MSGDNETLRIPPRVMEGVLNRLGISRVIKIDGPNTDIYRDAGNSIEDYSSNRPDKATCSNGAQPTNAQIQEAIRRTLAGEAHKSSNQTIYHFNSSESPLDRMCEVAPRPARRR